MNRRIPTDQLSALLSLRGTPVFARGARRPTGRTTGGHGSYPCRLEGCGGYRIGVRWARGQLTFPCTNGMAVVRYRGSAAWRIL